MCCLRYPMDKLTTNSLLTMSNDDSAESTNKAENISRYAKIESGGKMAFAVGALDEAIREYLLYRGFTQSLKFFEVERRDDKDKGFSFRVSTFGRGAWLRLVHIN